MLSYLFNRNPKIQDGGYTLVAVRKWWRHSHVIWRRRSMQWTSKQSSLRVPRMFKVWIHCQSFNSLRDTQWGPYIPPGPTKPKKSPLWIGLKIGFVGRKHLTYILFCLIYFNNEKQIDCFVFALSDKNFCECLATVKYFSDLLKLSNFSSLF